jgi:hypothetical protein
MHTRNNVGSGVRKIVSCTKMRPATELGPRAARKLRLSPRNGLDEVEWRERAAPTASAKGDGTAAGTADRTAADASRLVLKAHFIDTFSQLWLLLRNLFFGADPRFALPDAWREQLVAGAPRRTHTSASGVARALTPLSADDLRAGGVVGQTTLFVTGVSHGASLAQAFHLYFNACRAACGASHLGICSVHYGACAHHTRSPPIRHITSLAGLCHKHNPRATPSALTCPLPHALWTHLMSRRWSTVSQTGGRIPWVRRSSLSGRTRTTTTRV